MPLSALNASYWAGSAFGLGVHDLREVQTVTDGSEKVSASVFNEFFDLCVLTVDPPTLRAFLECLHRFVLFGIERIRNNRHIREVQQRRLSCLNEALKLMD